MSGITFCKVVKGKPVETKREIPGVHMERCDNRACWRLVESVQGQGVLLPLEFF